MSEFWFVLGRAAVLHTQAVRVAIPHTAPSFLPACTVEIAARAALDALPEQRAEVRAWRARSEAATRRQRLRRAMTPALRGHRDGPRCA